MAKFRNKPVVIEAMQVPMNDDETALSQHGKIWGFFCSAGFEGFKVKSDRGYDIQTLEGVMHASPGDWIIKGVKGEFYPCKPDIFEATYEPA